MRRPVACTGRSLPRPACAMPSASVRSAARATTRRTSATSAPTSTRSTPIPASCCGRSMPIRIRSPSSRARRRCTRDACTFPSRRAKKPRAAASTIPAARSAAASSRSMRRRGVRSGRPTRFRIRQSRRERTRRARSSGPARARPSGTRRRSIRAIGRSMSPPATHTPSRRTNTDAVMAIHMDTGRVLWSVQDYENDAWLVGCAQDPNENCPKDLGPDFDFGTSPILQTLAGRPAGAAGGPEERAGLCARSRRTGKLLWKAALVDKIGESEILFGGAADEGDGVLRIGQRVARGARPRHRPAEVVSSSASARPAARHHGGAHRDPRRRLAAARTAPSARMPPRTAASCGASTRCRIS